MLHGACADGALEHQLAVVNLLQCENIATPEAVLALDKEQLRGVGLSYAKVCCHSTTTTLTLNACACLGSSWDALGRSWAAGCMYLDSVGVLVKNAPAAALV